MIETMSDDDIDEFDDDDDLMEQIIQRTDGLNRQVSEKVIRHNVAVQRTLTGEKLDENEPTRYEEIQREITFHPTHHELNRVNLSTYIYPSNFEVRDYQFDIIRKALFKNLLCAIPTGMGKTFVASTVMLNYYRWFTKGKIIFMAPTRPLVAQQIQACLGVTDIPSSDTAILLDKSRRNRPEIWNSKRVFFTTPQVVENDLKTGILNPKDIVCLVIDEAHRARGNYAYTNVVQFIYRFNTSFRVLALTATPASDISGVQEVVDNLKISLIEIRTEESMDIVKYMKRKDTVRIPVGLNCEMEDIIELLGIAITPILKQANEANLYDVTDPSRISHFVVLQKSQAVIRNPSIPEGPKWKYYFILQVIGYVGQMIRRLKIYGIRTFYSYFQNKCAEFRTKYAMGKSTNKTSATFFYHDSLKQIEKMCDELLNKKTYISHPKLESLTQELVDFFEDKKDSRVIIFTELRESALEIVQCIDNVIGDKCKPHIFIGQARAKEGFDEDGYKLKNAPKGRGKQKKLEREEKERELEEERDKKKRDEAEKRAASRTATSEEAQIQGMNQKLQKELIRKFKKGEFNVLVATSIGEEGLDIGEVDLIICYDSTSSPIKNIQRMGRTGRKNDGKVILLLSGSEESKFDQSMAEYASVQKQISQGGLNLIKSDKILPKDIQPTCVKRLIDIPEDNLIIARGADEDEVIKFATQAMLGKNLPKAKKGKGKILKGRALAIETPPPKKRFFMPDNVTTGFVNSSKLVKKVDDASEASANSSKKDVSVLLSSDGCDDDEAEDDAYLTSTTKQNDSSILGQSTSRLSSSSKVSSAKKQYYKPSLTAVLPSLDRNDAAVDGVDAAKVLGSSPKGVSSLITTPYMSREDSPSKATDIVSSPPSAAQEPQEVKDTKSAAINKAELLKDFEFEISDSEADEADESYMVYKSPKKVPSQNNRVIYRAVHQQLLDFSAFEEDNELTSSVIQPLEEAERVMNKEYDNDPEFNDVTLETDSYASDRGRPSKRKSDEGFIERSRKIRKDITSLLQEKKDKTRNFKPEKADMSKVDPSEIIDIQSQSQKPQPLKTKKTRKKDVIFINEFEINDGFLDKRESDEFFHSYFANVEIGPMSIDPSISVRRDVVGHIKNSTTSYRFKRVFSLGNESGKKRLEKLVDDMTSRMNVKQEIKNEEDNNLIPEVMVGEDQIEYLSKTEPVEIILEDGSDLDSDLEITRENILEEGSDIHSDVTSITLLSEDDEEFMNL